jgi:hypothetical protein
VPILERESGLKFNADFFCGYSPERINPGDREHRLTTIRKVVGSTEPPPREGARPDHAAGTCPPRRQGGGGGQGDRTRSATSLSPS